MFCYQCEQAAKGTGCTMVGICGKDVQTADLQDLLVAVTKRVGAYAYRARKLGVTDRHTDRFVIEALFTTVTNVNFDPERVAEKIREGAAITARIRGLYEEACLRRPDCFQQIENLMGLAPDPLASDIEALAHQGQSVGVQARIASLGQERAYLHDLVLLGLKGMAAYADHAMILGREDDAIYSFFHEALSAVGDPDTSSEQFLQLALRCGEMNLKTMELLDAANTGSYGDPVPTRVRITPRAGKAIVVSGHDLKDLEELLKQTQGTGINVYTHGEMLPAHGYPGLKKYAHLVGNYGGAWQDQIKEFDAFPGAILMTTNCIQRPKDSYRNRIFTSGLVAWPGVAHIRDRNFAPVIKAALDAPGFATDEPERYITVGFARNTLMSLLPRIVEAVKAGTVRHVFLIGGCDGAKSGRNYYTDIAKLVPQDCLILTLACGKYRFNKLDFGEVNGIPRLLDCGQCNDAFSAIRFAVALAKEFSCSVNDLPLSLILSWYEQKAVVILLTLLHLGLRNIRLGPSLPAFVAPATLRLLSEKFNLMPISEPHHDLETILAE